MLQKITKKLVATLVAAATAFTLLFMAQPAQARIVDLFPGGGGSVTINGTEGGTHTVNVPPGFDVGKCLLSAGASLVGFDGGVGGGTKGIAKILQIVGRVVKVAANAAKIINPIGNVILVADALAACAKNGFTPGKTYSYRLPPTLTSGPSRECIEYDQTHPSGPRCQRR